MRPAILLLLFGLVMPSTTVAEVRLLSRGGASVKVHPGAGSAWEPSGRIDGAVLNPLGALHGDSEPTLAGQAESVLAAWVALRPTPRLHIAVGDDAWTDALVTGDVDPRVAPQVIAWDGAWIVGWTSDSAGLTHLALVSESADIESSLVVAPGAVQGLAIVGSTLHVLIESPSGILSAVTTPLPDERPWIFRSMSRTLLSDHVALPTAKRMIGDGKVTALRVPQHVPVVFRTASAGGAIAPADASTAFLGDWQRTSVPVPRTGVTQAVGSVALAGSSVAVFDVAGRSGLAAWWRDPQTLEFVELLDGGVGEVRQVTGRGEFSPALVREALRIVVAE